MFDQIVAAIIDHPYLAVAVLFVLCGLGLPLPEEIVLLAGGYVCAKFPEHAQLHWMMAWCAGGILVGDVLPYLLGRVFGVRLLRLRWLRYIVTKQRLASFDRWFRRRGDWVILIARFIPGLRVVAFFTGGTMKMSWQRFLCLDGLGILLIVPLLTWLGYHSASVIESVIATVQTVERGILWAAAGAGLLLSLWWWLWRRRRRLQQQQRPAETFIQPQRPIQEPLPESMPAPGQEPGREPPAKPDQADARAGDGAAPPATGLAGKPEP
jgi:membrane protein DedA with SNARE-associated domain